MSYYRLYFMDTFYGHIERFEEIEASSDDSALTLAKTRLGPLAIELWCRDRKVARLEALDLSSQLLAQRRVLKAAKAQVEPLIMADDTASENRSA